MAKRIYSKVDAPELRRRLSLLPAMFAGRAVDRWGIVAGFKMRLAWTFFTQVYNAYIVKARGGTDDSGDSWKWLSIAYLAYGRRGLALRFNKSQAKQAGARLGGKRAYNLAYREQLKLLMLTMSPKEARARAKVVAAGVTFERGKVADNKLALARTFRPGADYEILRDTGVLLNSLAPGYLTGESYTPKSDSQIVKDTDGALIVGTNVPYARYHHAPEAGSKMPERRLWPRPEDIPQSWRDEWHEQAEAGFSKIVEVLGGAA